MVESANSKRVLKVKKIENSMTYTEANAKLCDHAYIKRKPFVSKTAQVSAQVSAHVSAVVSKKIATTRLKCELQRIRNLPRNSRCIMSSVLRLRLSILKRGNSTNNLWRSWKALSVPPWQLLASEERKTFNPWLARWSAATKAHCKVACPRYKTRVKLIRIIYLKIISTGSS